MASRTENPPDLLFPKYRQLKTNTVACDFMEQTCFTSGCGDAAATTKEKTAMAETMEIIGTIVTIVAIVVVTKDSNN